MLSFKIFVFSKNVFLFSKFQIIFFVGGWIFFVKQLFRDYEVRNVSVQLIFSVTFALSLTMFELIIFEIIGFLDSSSRYFHWRLELTLLLMLVIAIIPFYIAFSIISNIRIVPKKYVKSLTTLVWFVYLYIFWRIGDPFPLLSVSQGIFTIEQVSKLKPHFSNKTSFKTLFVLGCF